MTFPAVSYTHLDVYKRQGVERALPGVGHVLRRILSRGLGADLGDVHQAGEDRQRDRSDAGHAK